MLTAITIFCWILLLALTFFGLYRGSSAMLCTGLLLIAAVIIASFVTPAIAGQNQGKHQLAIISQGYWQLFLLLFFGILAFPLGAYLNRFLQWSFDPFDHLLGLFIGVFVGGLIVNFVLISMLMIYHGTPEYKNINKLFVVRQMVHMDGWKTFSLWVKTIGNSQGSTPTD